MGTLHLIEKIKMIKVILIIIAIIGFLLFVYFSRIDGYLNRIEQFSKNAASDKPNSLKILIFHTKDTKPYFN